MNKFSFSALNKIVIFSLMVLLANCALIRSVKAKPATMMVKSSLKALPDTQSSDLQELLENDPVEVLKRERGWYFVSSEQDIKGWVKLIQVRFKPIDFSASALERSSQVSLRQGHSNITATTGVRGIGETEIANAKPDFESLEKSKEYVVSEKDAESFAKKIPLILQQIEYQEKRNEK